MSRAELDPLPILQALGVRGPRSVTPVAGGADARIWRVDYPRSSFALRVLRPEQQATAAREIVAFEAAGAAGLPVPALHLHGAWNGYPAMLLGWCEGRTLLALLGEQPWRARSLALAFGRAQARIHQLAAPPALSSEWIGWAGDDPALAARLRQAATAAPRLLHLDYHPLNVLFDGEHISAILDWANARGGDPRADVARTYSILRVEPGPPGASPALAAGRRVLSFYWRRGYEQVAGKLDSSALFRAWAGAVMQRDLAHRVGQPGGWWTQQHLDRIRRWTEQQRRAAGV